MRTLLKTVTCLNLTFAKAPKVVGAEACHTIIIGVLITIPALTAIQANARDILSTDHNQRMRLATCYYVSLPSIKLEITCDKCVTRDFRCGLYADPVRKLVVPGTQIANQSRFPVSTTIQVSSAAALASALAAAKGGETILLAAGDYGALDLYGARDAFARYSSTITIRSLDAEQPATFSSLKLRDVQNISFESITFDYTAAVAAPDWTRPFSVSEASNVAFYDSVFDGDLAEGLDLVRDGYGTGVGLFVTASTDIRVERCEFFDFTRGGVFDNVVGLGVVGNDLHDLRSDGLDFASVQDVLIQGNRLHDFRTATDSSDHADMIQFWTSGTTTPTSNITIDGNFLSSGSGGATQSIFMRNELVDLNMAGVEMFYQNVRITNNVIYNGHSAGIIAGETNGLLISGNTVLQNSYAGDESLLTVPAVRVAASSYDVQVTDNVSQQYGLLEGPDWIVDNNLVVQSSDPSTQNFVGNLFVNALAGANASLVDLMALPGGLVEQMGVGASLSQFDPTPDSPLGYLQHASGSGIEQLRQTLEIGGLFGPQGTINLTDLPVTWDFGDGYQSTERSPTHYYATGGNYEVTARVAIVEGIVTLRKTIVVQSPVALSVDFNVGVFDLSDVENASTIAPEVALIARDDGQAAQLNGATISYASSSDFFNNREYTLLVDFRKLPGQEGATSRLVNFSGSFVVNVTAASLEVAVTTDRGTVWLRPMGLDISNTDWHSVALTFSGTEGTAVLYLDGAEVARAAGLDGAVQLGSANQAFVLGSPSGASFQGQVDNVAFLRGALSSYQIAQGFSSLDSIIHPETSPSNTLYSDVSADISISPTTLNLVLVGSGNIDGSGNDLNNTIIGNAGHNVLDGRAGSNTLVGGLGNDTYVLANRDDTVIEDENGGWDTITSTISRDLSDYPNVENLTLLGSDHITATGNAWSNMLVGNDGDNILDGGPGADTLMGGLGNDTYVLLGATNDTIIDVGGIDTIESTITRDLRSYADIENLTLTFSAHADAIGNELDNVLRGNVGRNTLLGLAGSDTLYGGDGNDTLDGGDGLDWLYGGLGNDVYVMGDSFDVVSDEGGWDTMTSTISRNLNDYSDVENLTLLGSANINATGNVWSNKLIGNDGDNILDGGPGADILMGGLGNDTYVLLGATNDTIYDVGGVDTITSTISRDLRAYSGIENLTLTFSAWVDATGNEFANTLTGNSGRNILTGLDGDDILLGMAGNDTLFGGDGNDLLDGGDGQDALDGGLGNDTYVLGNGFDVIVDAGGWDTITSTISRDLNSYPTIENLTLLGTASVNATGNAWSNTLIGNAGDNVLDGGPGADILIGGLGNDTYVLLGATNDTIFDVGGIDTITSTISRNLADYTGIENITLTFSGWVDAIGDGNANVLTGNAGNNLLEGRGGDDVLFGGAGNDVLIGGLGADTIAGGSGKDRFVFESALDSPTDACDVITDFVSGEDCLDFRAIDAVGGGADDAFDLLLEEGSAFSQSAGQMRWFIDGAGASSSTFVEFDSDGDGLADFQLKLAGAVQLSHSDFLL